MAPPSTNANGSTFTLVLGLLAFAPPTSANLFLERLPDRSSSEVGADFASALLTEIEGVLGSEHRKFTEKRLGRIVESMRVSYAAAPQNEYGRLGHAAASYVLHRLFVQRHAWSVIGLDPAGDSMAVWNSSATTKILEKRVPEHVLGVFEERLGGRGLGLEELAVLAATLEHLVHKESMERLRVSYLAHNFSTEDVLSDTDADMVIDSYMAYYLLGSIDGNISIITPGKVQAARKVIHRAYPTWNMTQEFVRVVKERIAPSRDDLYFSDVAAVVEEIGHLYGRWQNSECRDIKALLVGVEDARPMAAGRVRLADFYRKVVYEGAWQLSESVQSLRHMGAIDDSDPNDMLVIIPNYVYSPANCVAGSTYYSVCCIDECDGLLAGLESKFARPDLLAHEIATHVSSMPSTTVPGNRTLPAWLVRRLEEIAAHHGGRVPLHGRLFAQWMHYAYPRECRYPHVSGTTDPLRTRVTLDSYKDNTATNEEMLHFIDVAISRERVAQNATTGDKAEQGGPMWTMEEELVVWRSTAQAPGLARLSRVLRGGVLFGVLAPALAVTLARGITSEFSGLRGEALQKYYV